MAYFPFFADIQGKEAVVVGGGKIACRRILSLLPFGCRIRVIAPEIGPELKAVLDDAYGRKRNTKSGIWTHAAGRPSCWRLPEIWQSTKLWF